MTDPPDQELKYVPTKRIRNVGTYYTIYEATQTGLDRPVELRILNHEVQPDSPEFKRFANEFRTLASLDHPNILRVLDLGIVKKHVFYVTDLRQARSFRDLMSEADFEVTPRDVVTIGRCLASAVNHLHQRKILHRNLSADTIYLDQETRIPYIAEFSMVKNFNLDNLTGVGVPQMVGWIHTPEFQRGEDFGDTVDIFLLGRLLFQLLTFRTLDKAGKKVRAPVLEEDPEHRHPRYFDATIPPELDEIVARCLEPEPAGRYSDAKTLLEALEVAEEKIGVKHVLSRIAETDQQERVSRSLEKQAGSIRAHESRRTTKRFDTAAEGEAAAATTVRRTLRYGAGTQAATGLVSWIKARKSTIQLIMVPTVVLGIVGFAVWERSTLNTETDRAHMAEVRSKRVRLRPEVTVTYDAQVESEASSSQRTNQANFQDRWYLLDNWISQLLRERKTPPFGKADLIEARKASYRDEEMAARKVDALLELALSYLESGPKK